MMTEKELRLAALKLALDHLPGKRNVPIEDILKEAQKIVDFLEGKRAEAKS